MTPAARVPLTPPRFEPLQIRLLLSSDTPALDRLSVDLADWRPVAAEHEADASGPQTATASAAQAADGTISAESQANQPPVVDDLEVSGEKGLPITADLPGRDDDGHPLTYTVVTAPSHGTVTIDQQAGTFTYTPGGEFLSTSDRRSKMRTSACRGCVVPGGISVARNASFCPSCDHANRLIPPHLFRPIHLRSSVRRL
ncbi:MAG: hypothetical protein AMK72_10335 [Planctomycetes bacterium SM23_25]|nr:MAG: hypothetical protein AMK72_10335 [Planctomycetes bacterium SM23_25]